MLQPVQLLETSRPSSQEHQLRIEIAAACRLLDRLEMSDMTSGYMSVKLPDEEERYLVTPYGLLFNEITASSIVKVDFEGNIVGDSSHNYTIYSPGFIYLNRIIHRARPDAQAIMHLHPIHATALSSLAGELLPCSEAGIWLYRQIGYGDFILPGGLVDEAQEKRLVSSLGDKQILMVRNHGTITLGTSIPEAFLMSVLLENACKIQLLAESTGRKLICPPEETCLKAAQQLNDVSPLWDWNALVRQLDRQESSYQT